MKISRVVLKVVFIFITVGMVTYNSYDNGYKPMHAPVAKSPIKNGVYEVTGFALNNVQLPITDTLRWKDAIFENGTGSTISGDTLYRHRYGRAYFNFKADSVTHKFNFLKAGDNSVSLGTYDYTLPDTNTVQLTGKNKMGDIVIDLKRTKRHFQLAEKQFHWLSEHNR
jgi:hypothetical protein